MLNADADQGIQRPARKRRRPAVVCTECRRRKIACDKQQPCNHCVQYRTACIYSESSTLAPTRAPKPASTVLASPENSSAFSNGSPRVVEGYGQAGWMMNSPQSIQQADSFRPDDGLISTERPKSSAPVDPTRSSLRFFMEKSRLHGQSHWMGSCIQFVELGKFNNSGLFDKTSDMYILLDKCKRLSRRLKSYTAADTMHFREHVPAREVCDCLTQAYFATFESVTRVLHVPMFQREYAEYWANPGAATDQFVIKLLLVAAIGAFFYRGPHNPDGALDTSAARWIGAAQRWLGVPIEKRRVDFHGVQIYCLILIALQTNGVGSDLSWIAAGSLLRTAMMIGLHRDPKHFPNFSIFKCEMRRRLWATTRELVLQASLDAGMPALINLEDSDCEPPSNIDDVQINEDTKVRPSPQPLTVFTQTSILCALVRSLPTRLKTVSILNSIGPLSYDDALRNAAELSDFCRSTSSLFGSLLSSSPSQGHPLPTNFQLKVFDILTRRFLLSIHTPFAQQAINNIGYYYSRKVCLECSLVLLSRQWSSGTPSSLPSEDDYYTKLRIDGRGLFRGVPLQASNTVFWELIMGLRDDSSPTTSSLSKDELYQTALDWIDISRRRMESTETNVKAYVLGCAAIAQVEAMQSGASVAHAVTRAARASLEECYRLLRARLDRLGILTPETPSVTIPAGDADGQIQADDSFLTELLASNSSSTLDVAGAWLFSGWDNDESWF